MPYNEEETIKITTILLEAGADPYLKTAKGTAFTIADKDPRILDLLEKFQAKPTQKGSQLR